MQSTVTITQKHSIGRFETLDITASLTFDPELMDRDEAATWVRDEIEAQWQAWCREDQARASGAHAQADAFLDDVDQQNAALAKPKEGVNR
jgi:hypothetical protein